MIGWPSHTLKISKMALNTILISMCWMKTCISSWNDSRLVRSIVSKCKWLLCPCPNLTSEIGQKVGYSCNIEFLAVQFYFSNFRRVQKHLRSLVGDEVFSLVYPLSYRWNMAILSLLSRYFHIRCSDILLQTVIYPTYLRNMRFLSSLFTCTQQLCTFLLSGYCANNSTLIRLRSFSLQITTVIDVFRRPSGRNLCHGNIYDWTVPCWQLDSVTVEINHEVETTGIVNDRAALHFECLPSSN